MNEHSEGKGTFAADISAKAVADALRSVEDATAASASETHETTELSADVEKLREELRQKDVFLDESTQRGREAMEHLKEANERMLRAAADLDNYKKRAQKEKEELQKYGNERLLRELLPVLDNFDRALEHAEKSPDISSFAQGVAMTRKLFEDTLAKFGVKSFSAVGQSFDPHHHEAVQQVESAVYPAQTVVQELVRGYELNERLIRPAMVVVSKGPGPTASGPTSSESSKTTEPELAEHPTVEEEQ